MAKHRAPWNNLAQLDEFDPRLHVEGAYGPGQHRASTRADQLAAICASPTALAHLQEALGARLLNALPTTGYHEDDIYGVPA